MIKIFDGWGQVMWMQTETERHPEDNEGPRGLAEVGCLDRFAASLEMLCLFSWQSSSSYSAEVLEFFGYAYLSYWITRGSRLPCHSRTRRAERGSQVALY